jgi:hypothetical protein
VMQRNRTSSLSTFVNLRSIHLVRCGCSSFSRRRSLPTHCPEHPPMAQPCHTTRPGSSPGLYYSLDAPGISIRLGGQPISRRQYLS